jgi:hypothetical protein
VSVPLSAEFAERLPHLRHGRPLPRGWSGRQTTALVEATCDAVAPVVIDRIP